MTISRRAAFAIAIDCIAKEMRHYAFDANVAARDPNAPETTKQRAMRYIRLAEALKWFESAGRQTEMKL